MKHFQKRYLRHNSTITACYDKTLESIKNNASYQRLSGSDYVFILNEPIRLKFILILKQSIPNLKNLKHEILQSGVKFVVLKSNYTIIIGPKPEFFCSHDECRSQYEKTKIFEALCQNNEIAKNG